MEKVKIKDLQALFIGGSFISDAEKIFTLWADIKEKRQAVTEAEHFLNNTVDSYSKKRQEFIRDSVHGEGKDWCTKCGKLFPMSEFKKVYIHGDHWVGSEYTEHVENFSELHSACSQCYEKMRDLSGKNERGENKFFAHRVEKRNGVLMYNDFGSWSVLPEKMKIIEAFPSISSDMEKNYKVPPELSIGWGGQSELEADRAVVTFE